MAKKPLILKRANIHRPSGPKHRGRFELRDGKKIVGKSDHSTINDRSIQGSAEDILSIARKMERKIRTKDGLIDPSDEDDDEDNARRIR